MNHRFEPIMVYHADCGVTADQVRQWANEDGYPGDVQRCERGFSFSIGSTVFFDGDQWHLWKVGL